MFPAELGRNTGAVAIASTKSGTNQFHGTAFEFYEDAEKLNARTNIEKAANAADPNVFKDPRKLRRDTYGFTVGGPVQRDRMFFFGAYQRIPFEGRGAAVPILSPTAEGRALLASAPGVDRSTLALLNTYIPLPNSTPRSPTTVAGVSIPLADYVATLPNTSLNNQVVARVDRTLSSNDNIYGRYIYAKNETVGASNPPGFANDRCSRRTTSWAPGTGSSVPPRSTSSISRTAVPAACSQQDRPTRPKTTISRRSR